ncbi:hypothetical protein VW23_021005 [Devosia insulae DS-56]|uniref:Spore coat protein U domain-containing protein n=1 Tax=Devosia insulae DS-56 TaxID=1116389 RepID=A0A1E5XPE7_9HYPH|nr:hypothetical protein [Devosia insulae]OEO30482.1 hypothetical protein VW23_021005 [Devosia insulae DS-56]
MRVLVVATTVCLLAGIVPASAQSVNLDFTGTVIPGCTLSASDGGTLGLDYSTGTTLGSEEAGGDAAHVTILSIGANTLTVGAPTRTGQAAGYVATGEAIQVRYTGATGLSSINVAYTSSQTTNPITTIAASVLTVHNRITNPNGFPNGNYSTRTVVTCAP